jgi:hypothetical protein
MELRICGHTGIWGSGYVNMQEYLTEDEAGISDDIMDIQGYTGICD